MILLLLRLEKVRPRLSKNQEKSKNQRHAQAAAQKEKIEKRSKTISE